MGNVVSLQPVGHAPLILEKADLIYRWEDRDVELVLEDLDPIFDHISPDTHGRIRPHQ